MHRFIEVDDEEGCESGQPSHRYLAAFDTEDDELLVAAMRNALPALLDIVTEASSHNCDRYRRSLNHLCRMCAAFAALEDADAE